MRRRLLFALIALRMFIVDPAAANVLAVEAVHEACVVEFEGGFTVHLTAITVPDATTTHGREAHDFAKRRLEGTRVAVFTWTTDNTTAGIVRGDDRLAFATIMYGKGLSADIAAELLERGLARVDTEHLPDGYEHYLEIERAAQVRGLGMWAR